MSRDPGEAGPDLERVSKLLARRGLCSRREAERLIEVGAVVVDGQVVTAQGAKAARGACIEITEAGRRSLGAAISIALHKPVGVVSTNPAETQRDACALVTRDAAYGTHDDDEIERVLAGVERLAVAGRLDRASRGLLILTTDGVVARALVGGNAIAKSYLVTLTTEATQGQIARLNRPMRLDERQLLPMKVKRAGPLRLRFELVEGMKHQIRRCCSKVGLEVEDLLRDAVGSIRLGDLPEGRWRILTAREVEGLRSQPERRRRQRPAPKKT